MSKRDPRQPGRSRPLPSSVAAARARWNHRGARRPDFAVAPGEGQESVWDYPRPPRIEPDSREVVIADGSGEVARTRSAARVLETASPPTYYVPWSDVVPGRLVPDDQRTYCEWKGEAHYWRLAADPPGAAPVAWSVPEPLEEFTSLRDFVAFYPGRVSCWLAGERVRAQAGGYYAGWVTDAIVGPFKGDPGSGHW